MEKINIGNNPFLLPMPQVIVGANIGERPNFMAVGWVARVNFQPAMMAISLGPHATTDAIVENGQFSINIPSVDLMAETDLTGLVTGAKFDKSSLFDVFYGSLPKAPLIRECPVAIECRLVQTVQLPTNHLFIGEVAGVWTEERFLTGGNLDIEKVRPFTLTMPDNGYWAVGEKIGRAWHDGLTIRNRLEELK